MSLIKMAWYFVYDFMIYVRVFSRFFGKSKIRIIMNEWNKIIQCCVWTGQYRRLTQIEKDLWYINKPLLEIELNGSYNE